MTFGRAANAVAEAFVTLRADTKQFEQDSQAAINKVFKNVDAETQRALNQTFFPDAARAQEKAAQQAQAAADKQFKAIAKGAVATGAALTTTGLLALKFSNDFDAAFDRIAAGTGATGQRLDSLNQSFENVFRDVPADMATVAEAITALSTRTGLAGKPLEELAAQLVNVSRLTGTDVTANAEAVTRAFGDWGISTGNQAEALDKLFRASQLTGPSIEQIGRLVVQFGAPLRQFGFSFEEAAALMGKFEKEGVNTELVMGSLRIALGRFATEGRPAKEALQETIEEIRRLGPSAASTSLAIETFGARAGPDMAAAIREGKFEIESLFAAIQAGEGSIAKTAAETDDWREKLTLLKNNVLATSQPFLDQIALVGTLGGSLLSMSGSIALVAGNMQGLRAGATAAVNGLKALGAAALVATPWVVGLSVAIGLAFLAYQKWGNSTPAWKREIEALGSSTAKLAELELKLAKATGIEQAEIFTAIQRLKESDRITDQAAVTTAKYEKSARDAALATGTFEERAKALNDQLGEMFQKANDAFSALDQFKNAPTQEQLELNAALSRNSANLAQLEQNLVPVTRAYEDNKDALERQITAIENSIAASRLQGRDTSALEASLFNLKRRLDEVNDAYDTDPVNQMIEAFKREQEVLQSQKGVLDANRDATINMGKAKIGASGQVDGLLSKESDLTGAVEGATSKLSGQADVMNNVFPSATAAVSSAFDGMATTIENRGQRAIETMANLAGAAKNLGSIGGVTVETGGAFSFGPIFDTFERAVGEFKSTAEGVIPPTTRLKDGIKGLGDGFVAAGKTVTDTLSELRSQLFSGGTREELQNQLRQAQLSKTLSGLPEGSGQVETLRKHIEAQLEAARKSGESMQANNRIQDLRLQLANKAIPTEKEQNLAFEKLLISTEKLTTGMPSVLAANADLAGLIRMDVIPAKQAEIDAAYKLRDGVDSFWEKVNGLIAVAPAGAPPAAPVAPTATTAAAPEIVIKLNLDLDGDLLYQAVLRRMPGDTNAFGSVT